MDLILIKNQFEEFLNNNHNKYVTKLKLQDKTQLVGTHLRRRKTDTFNNLYVKMINTQYNKLNEMNFKNIKNEDKIQLCKLMRKYNQINRGSYNEEITT